MQRRLAALVSTFALAVLAACGDGPPTTLSQEVVDAPEVAAYVAASAESGSRSTVEGMTFLDPIEEGDEGGAFDAGLLDDLAVDICTFDAAGGCGTVLSRFTSTSGSSAGGGKKGRGNGGDGQGTLRAADDYYQVNWSVKDVDGRTGDLFRIRVSVAGLEVGHADVVIVGNGRDRQGVDASQVVAVQSNRTLPIKFRIAPGAVFVAGPEGGTIESSDGSIRLDLPAGALSDRTGFRFEAADNDPADPTFVTATRIFPTDLAFGAPVGVTLSYADDAVADTVPEGRLRIHQVVDGAWVEPFESTTDGSGNVSTGSIDRAGVTGILRRRAPARVEVGVAGSPIAAFDGTATLTATAFAAGGWEIGDAVFEWNLADVASGDVVEITGVTGAVSETATVVGLSNGAGGVLASTEGVTNGAGVTVRQVAATLEPTLATDLLEAIEDTTGLAVLARDANGYEIVEDELVSLSWASSSTGVATLDGSGPRGAIVTARGNGVATLTLTDSQGATAAVEITVAQRPVGIVPIAGLEQTAEPGQALADPIVVEVQDANDFPIAGVDLVWAVEEGAGSLGAPTPATDANGRGQADFTLGGALVLNVGSVAAAADADVFATFEFAPTAPPVSTGGGEVEFYEGLVQLEVPAGALGSGQPISARPVDPTELGISDGDVAPGTLFDFGPDGLQFDSSDEVVEPEEIPESETPEEVKEGDDTPPSGGDPGDAEEEEYLDDEIDEEVEVPFDAEPLETEEPTLLTLAFDELPEGMTEDDLDALVIAKFDPETGEWIEQEGSFVDPETRTVSAPISSFSYYAVRARTSVRIYGPESGLVRRWTGFRTNVGPRSVTWRIYRKTRWPLRTKVSRRSGATSLYAFGPGPIIVQATAKVCSPTLVDRHRWVSYQTYQRLRYYKRVPSTWSLVRDEDGKIRTRVVERVNRYTGYTTRYRQILVNQPVRSLSCATQTARKTFTVQRPAPSRVVLVPTATLGLQPDRGAAFYVRVYDQNGRFMPWARIRPVSDNPGVLSFRNLRNVNSWDRWAVRAVEPGTATFRAVALDGGASSGPITVVVDVVPAEIILGPATFQLGIGESRALNPIVRNASGFPMQAPLTWSSSSSAVDVDSNGVVRAVSPGTATVTARTDNGVTASVTVTVPQPELSWSIAGAGSLSGRTDSDATGTARVMSYDLNPAGFSTRQWTVTATVEHNGTITVPWRYQGFHSFFNVRAFLRASVRRSGSSTEEPLANESWGPQNCCTPPSGGFNYSGSITIQNASPGDVIIFRMGGSNGDSNNVLSGNLWLYRP